jgi:hypothetical protein
MLIIFIKYSLFNFCFHKAGNFTPEMFSVILQGKYLRKKKKYVSFNVTTKIIKCQLFSLNIVCSIFFFHKADNFTPEMFSVIYGN